VSQAFLPSSDSWDSADGETADLDVSYRRMRDQIEREVLPRATSVGGCASAADGALRPRDQ